MSSVNLASPTGQADVFSRTEGADTVLMQAVVNVDPTTGLPIPHATETTLAQIKTVADSLLIAANAIQSAVEALDTGAIVGNVSVSNLPATQAVSGTVALDTPTLNALENINATTGGLTDAQLRASALAVSGTVALDTGSLNALENINASVSGTVALDAPTLAALESIQATTGGLTNTELRASALPVSLDAVPLASNAASETTLDLVRGFLANIFSFFKPEDSAHTSGDFGMPVLAIRSDNDIPTANDGDYTVLKLDEEGRLKVSAKPASYPDIVGDITAIQATIGTPVAGGTVGGDVSRASNVMAFCTGTFAGVNVTFEGSLEATGEANWFGLQAVRSNANTIESATGALSAVPAYAWELSVNGLKRVRVRCTARTSGTQSWRFVQGTYATEPIPAAQVSGTQPVSGTVTATVTGGTVNPVVPATPFILNSAANTNATLILTGTSGLQAFYATNTGATPAFVKLYNKATAPVLASDTPAMILSVPAAVSGVPGVCTLPIGFSGFRFALGLGIAITGGVADADATAVAAGQVKVMLSRTV